MAAQDQFTPVEGIDLPTYVEICRALVRRGHALPGRRDDVPALHGLDADRWAACRAGWAARLQERPEVRAEFRRLYSALTNDGIAD
jgi:hypothetical protein